MNLESELPGIESMPGVWMVGTERTKCHFAETQLQILVALLRSTKTVKKS